jgi:pyrroline-5-carboxylate reductase
MLGNNIAFIGAGNMARCIIQGLIHHGYSADKIIASNRSSEKLQRLVATLGIRSAASNREAVLQADVLVLAIKPKFVPEVCLEIAAVVRQKKPLFISLVTAAPLAKMMALMNAETLPAVRTMTNTPTEIGMGMTALFANQAVNSIQKQLTETLFNAVGQCFWLENEAEFNLYTPLVGCAPAYVFLWMEALQQAAIAKGIPAERAESLVKRVISGAVALASRSELSLQDLRQKVTTPQGVTAASLEPLLEADWAALFARAFGAGFQREAEISADLFTRSPE